LLRGLFIAFSLGLVLATSAAQAQVPNNSMEALRRSQLRNLQTRALGGGDVSGDARELQRQLRLDSPTGAPGGNSLTIDREARRLQQPSLVPPSASPRTPPAILQAPKSTTGGFPPNVVGGRNLIQTDPRTSSSPGVSFQSPRFGGNDNVTTASRLMSRAEMAMKAGRHAQARSDLDMAEHLLGALPAAADQSLAAGRVRTARDRLTSLRTVLAP
jgi:hypothetical protein